jgi:hypothetical protein
VKIEGDIRTPHDGVFTDPEVTFHRFYDQWVVSLNGTEIAYLNKETHRLWLWNPGLRDRILQQIRAETLVGA